MKAPLPLSIQLYTLRDRIQKIGFVTVLRELVQIGLPAVEFAGLHGLSANTVRSVLDGEGLKASSAHAPVFDPAQWSAIEDAAKRLGCRHIIGGFGPDDFKNDDSIKAAAQKVNAAVNHFRSRDLTVGYHNHEWEFVDPSKAALFYGLIPDAGVQIDIYWVKTGGACPAEIIRRYARRAYVLHIKDGPANIKDRNAPMTAAGQGTVPIAECVKAAEGAATEYLAIELDHCATDMLTAVRESVQYMVRHGLARARS